MNKKTLGRDSVLAALSRGVPLGARELQQESGLGNSIYKILRQLLKQGQIERCSKAKTGRRPRQLYQLTRKGNPF